MIRHDTAHVLAEAVQELYPGTQVTIGPAIENGFYYDFARNEPFTPDDFPQIEAKMREIIARNAPFVRSVMPREEAIAFFENKGERYKAELIRDLPESEEISLYSQGDWIDLCRGPHLRGTGDVGPAFKLTKVAGAYWRGDHRNAMLSRIYGTAWRDQKELDAYLHQIEEAERRDHRKIGAEMDLFHLQEEARGSIFWHPKGWRLYRTLEGYMRRRLDRAGYDEVKTPQLVDRKLWIESGHWEKFRESMFIATVEDESEGPRPRAEADELPLPRADLQPGHQVVPPVARCAWPSSAPATATSPRAPCTALCGSAPSRRMTRTSSARSPGMIISG
jgi:threonyl-tRNA synthetase